MFYWGAQFKFKWVVVCRWDLINLCANQSLLPQSASLSRWLLPHIINQAFHPGTRAFIHSLIYLFPQPERFRPRGWVAPVFTASCNRRRAEAPRDAVALKAVKISGLLNRWDVIIFSPLVWVRCPRYISQIYSLMSNLKQAAEPK